MPRGQIYKEKINKEVFLEILKQKNYSIAKLVRDEIVDCNEKTIRRSLNEGRITPRYLNSIAQKLDIDPRFLSGQIHMEFDDLDEKFRKIFYSYLDVNEYPFSRMELEENKKTGITNFITAILNLYDISYEEYDKLDFDTQTNIDRDLITSIGDILIKYFKKDSYGKAGLPKADFLLYDLDNYIENHYQLVYADTTLRDKYTNNPPKGFSSKDIINMSAEEIFDLDVKLDWETQKNDYDQIASKYKVIYPDGNK